MTAAELRFWRRVQSRASGLTPELASKIQRAFRELRESLTESELERIMASGQLDALFSADGPLDPVTIRQAFLPVRDRFRDGVTQAAKAFAKDLPTAAREVGFGGFDVLNPDVIEGIRTLESKVIQTLEGDVRETVRAFTERGLREGVGPRTIARELRTVIGLAPNQVDAIANFRNMLEAGDREALTRALRDKRFDRTLVKAFAGEGLSTAQIDRMTDAYAKRMVAFNAETHARTAALDAQKLGQQLTWDQAVERGDVDGEKLTKTWTGVLDDRERPEHVAMEGETVPHDQPYSNGQMIPGETEWNCRCVSLFSLLRAA